MDSFTSISNELLAVDVGNTGTCWGVFRGVELAATGRMPTRTWRKAAPAKLPPEWDIGGPAIVSSVLHGIPFGLAEALSEQFPRRTFVYPKDLAAGLPLEIDAPDEVGPDRLATALGALRRAPAKAGCIVIDAGTAITIDTITPAGAYAGGAIAAGIGLSMKALHEHTARLPMTDPEGEIVLPGRGTEQAMRAGVVLGTACMVEGLAERIAESQGITGPWFITGGTGCLLAPLMKRAVELRPHLALEGLAAAWRLHAGARSQSDGQ